MANQSEKLNREKKIANNKFSLILGTVNRLRPTTIYIDGRTFIMPLEAKTDYNEDLKAINKVSNKVSEMLYRLQSGLIKPTLFWIFR